MTDPFDKIRRLTLRRETATEDWREELRLLRAAGYSTRAIAAVAGVSHDTVWKAAR
jgi:DNA-directed RNA polymerase specialized sigma24 family protein